MLSLEELKVTLSAYEALLENRDQIESSACALIAGVPFDSEYGTCSFVGDYTKAHVGLDIYSYTSYIESMNLALGLDDQYPVVNEYYHANGNKWRTTNPTHNADGRWEYVAKCVQYIQNEIDNYEK